VQRWCRKCVVCEKTKLGLGKGKSSLIQEISGIPFDHVAFDLIVNLPVSTEGNKVILVVVDHFTKLADAFPMKDRKAETIAHHLLTRWIVYHSVPTRLHSDRGPELVGNVISQVCEVLGIEKTKTTPYRPQSDGQSERTIKTVTELLKTFVSNHNDLEWDTHIPFIMMAYRGTQHSSTGCSPHLMVHGREMVLPVDLMYHSHTPKRPWDSFGSCPTAYVEWLRRSLQVAHEFARMQLQKAAERQRTNYNSGLKPRVYKRGQWVWKLYPPFAIPKLGKPWAGPYLVIKQMNDVVYLIQQSANSKVEVQHVDHLKPCYSKEVGEDSWLPWEQQAGGSCPLDVDPTGSLCDSEDSDW